MSLALAPDVFLAVLGDDAVFLDIRSDAYLCVPNGRLQLNPSPDLAALDPEDPAMVEALATAGLLAPGCALARRDAIRLPIGDIEALPPARLRVEDLPPLAGALWDFLWRYRGCAFRRVLGFAQGAAPVHRATTTSEVLRLAAVFREAAVWLPIPRKCLARSFVLLRFLHRSGAGARWVFGVRTWPFSAHCWIQCDDVALDESAERLVGYAPILAIE